MRTQEILNMLCDKYPNCFYRDPKLGQPISKRIVGDLIEDGVDLPRVLIQNAVNFYKSDIGYQDLVVYNANRIDLDGSVVSHVTEEEANKASKYKKWREI